MTLEELEIQLKEIRDQGATDETEIIFIQYYKGANYLNFSSIDLYFPETSSETIEITFS